MFEDPPEHAPSTSAGPSGAGPARPAGMTPALFQAFRDLAYRKAGIQLRDGKEALVASRIARRMRDLGISDPRAYLDRLRADVSGEEMVVFLDCISTNLTGFYRDEEHFPILAEEAGRCLARGEKRFRVWCAAAASGEEAYTIALTLVEAFAGSAVDHRVIATDISTRALAVATRARYTERQLAPVPERLRRKYFAPAPRSQVDIWGSGSPDGALRPKPHGGEPVYEVSPKLRDRVVFGRMNLAAAPFPMTGQFDVIMCRNVMIYFDQPVRRRLVAELERLLRPGGLLVVGAAETLSGLRSPLQRVLPSVYRRPRC